MEIKDVQTNQSLSQENTIHQNIISYGQNMSQTQVLALVLGYSDLEDQNFIQNLMCYREQLQQALQKIERSKNIIYETHHANQKLVKCTGLFNSSEENKKDQNLAQKFIESHFSYINGVQSSIDALISKIKAWRNKIMMINKIKERTVRINRLILQKYNIRNYIQQMQLVQGMLNRVGSRLSSGQFNHIFLQQLMSKELIPYNFYHNYCYNIIFHLISTRVNNNELIVFKLNENLPELFNHMKNFFNRDLYSNCQQFIKLMKCIRIMNQQNRCLDDGFAHLFRPFFVRILEEIDEIQGLSFLKARSLMQYNQLTIDVWKEYEDFLLEKYILWNYQRHNLLKNSQLIHLIQLKESISFFKKNYQWINVIGLKSNKIHGNNNFPEELLKTAIFKILYPFVLTLYQASIPTSKVEIYEKNKKEFQEYWFCCIFGRYRNLYHFIGTQLKSFLAGKNITHICDNFEQSQLNIDQYYKYYQQMEEVLVEQLENKEVGKEFHQFWLQIWRKVCLLSQSIKQKDVKAQNYEEDDKIYRIKQLQINLEKVVLNKKDYKKDERADLIYGLLMNLNLNSCNFFLLREGFKCIDKSIEHEVNSIREAAYMQLFD